MANKVDLNGIKEQIQTILANANTTTASPVDLSSGLSNSVRVNQVLKIHPEMIIPQASFFPLVTCFVSEKTAKRMDIAGSQINSKRRSTVSVNIVGSIFNANISSVDEDPADEDIGHLMENIEWILRTDSTLGGKVNWHQVTNCEYFATILDEQTHLRSGILKLECEVWY
jgi:hypothetical protein